MEKNLYKTRDLGECAVLLLKNQRLFKMEKLGKTYWFYFENIPVCNQISNEYFFGDLTVNAREFYQMVTRLKNRIFS